MRYTYLIPLLLCTTAQAQISNLIIPLGGEYRYEYGGNVFEGESTTNGIWYGINQYWDADVDITNVDYTAQSTYPIAYLTTYIDGGSNLTGFMDFTTTGSKFELISHYLYGVDSTLFYIDGEPIAPGEIIWSEPGQHRFSWHRPQGGTSAALLRVEVPEPSAAWGMVLGLGVLVIWWRFH